MMSAITAPEAADTPGDGTHLRDDQQRAEDADGRTIATALRRTTR